MNKSITYILLILIFISCHKKTELTKMTVIYHSNQNIGLKWKQKELINDSLIDLEKAKIDLYFSQQIAKIPFYLPTNGIYKDSIKNNECNWEIYPLTVKCYKYDNKNRVKSMSVDESGTMGTWNYRYDEFDRIIEIKHLEVAYTIKYDNEQGLLKEIVKGFGIPNYKERERVEILYK